jgi:hypothetical protein
MFPDETAQDPLGVSQLEISDEPANASEESEIPQ